MGKKKNKLTRIAPDIIFHTGTQVPSKFGAYKVDPKTKAKILEEKISTHKFENDIKKKLMQAIKGIDKYPTEKELVVVLTHYENSEKSYREIDLDNKAKTLLDALKEVIYIDDSQVKFMFSNKALINDNISSCRICVSILSQNLDRKLSRLIDDMIQQPKIR